MSEVLKKKEYDKLERIISYLEENDEITTAEAVRICGKSLATARRYLKLLTETGYVITEGNTNNSKYKTKRKHET